MSQAFVNKMLVSYTHYFTRLSWTFSCGRKLRGSCPSVCFFFKSSIFSFVLQEVQRSSSHRTDKAIIISNTLDGWQIYSKRLTSGRHLFLVHSLPHLQALAVSWAASLVENRTRRCVGPVVSNCRSEGQTEMWIIDHLRFTGPEENEFNVWDGLHNTFNLKKTETQKSNKWMWTKDGHKTSDVTESMLLGVHETWNVTESMFLWETYSHPFTLQPAMLKNGYSFY